MSDFYEWELAEICKSNVVVKRPSRRPFLSFTRDYTHVNAYNCALLSELAYTDSASVQKFFEDAAKKDGRSFSYSKPEITNCPFFDEADITDRFIFGSDSFYSDPVTDTQFFIVHNSTQVIVSVRGTAGKKDIFQDAKATQVDFKEGKGQVHLGFYEGFGFVKKHLEAYLGNHPCADKEFIITGHSLGAAIATLTAAYLRGKHTSQVMLYTYGSPRVGNRTFANYYTGTKPFTYYRIVNGSDVVTMVPMPGVDLKPYLLPMGGPFILPLVLLDFDGDYYTHMGRVMHIQALENGSIIESEDANAAKFAKLLISPALLAGEVTLDAILSVKESFENHSLSGYIDILYRMMKLVTKSYLDIDSAQYSSLEADIKTLEKEVADLEQSEAGLLAQAKIHEELAASSQDPFLQSYHAVEAATLRLKAANLRVIIADKNVDLAHFRGSVQYYKERGKNKQRYLFELVGNGFYKSSMEAEFSYHANQ